MNEEELEILNRLYQRTKDEDVLRLIEKLRGKENGKNKNN